MSRPFAVAALAAALALAACGTAPEQQMPEAIAAAIRAEVGDALVPVVRPPLGAPAAEGDAAVDYAAAIEGMRVLPPALDAKARLEHGRLAKPVALPPPIAAAVADPAAQGIVATIQRGAARPHATSPFSVHTPLGQRSVELMALADLVVIAARAELDAGRTQRAGQLLLALIRMGQDVRRKSNLLGHSVGAALEARGARGLIDAVDRGAPDAATLAALRAPLAALAAEQPAMIDAAIDEARFRLALVGVATGTPLGVAWTTTDAQRQLDPLLPTYGTAPSLGKRALDEVTAYRALDRGQAAAPLAAAAVAACTAAWSAEFDGCARLGEVLGRIAVDADQVGAALRAIDAAAGASSAPPAPAPSAQK